MNLQSSSKLTVDSALGYLQKAERVLSKDEFAAFLEIIEDFKQQRIPTKTVVYKVKAIFKGKPDSLITDFNMFLPLEYHIMPEISMNKSGNFAIALKLVKKIRERFEKAQPKVLSTFIEILGKFQNDRITLLEARARVKELFKGQVDLLHDFNSFLPVHPQRNSVSHLGSEKGQTANSNRGNGMAKTIVEGMSLNSSVSSTFPSSRGNGRAVFKAGVQSNNTADGFTRTQGTAEKRKMGDQEPDSSLAACGKISDVLVGGAKRRLINVTKLHSTFKRCPETQSKHCGLENRPRSLRKSSIPKHMDIFSKEAVTCRSMRLFQQSELASVLPLPLLQKIQISLRALHSSGANAPRA